MPILDSKIDTRSEQFQQNRSDMMNMLSLLDGLLEEASKGGGTEAIARLRSRNKMPIRERISRLALSFRYRLRFRRRYWGYRKCRVRYSRS